MPSKDQRPSQRLGKSNPRRVKIITWTIALALCGGGAVAAYRYTGTTEVEVPVARVRRGEFIISVRTRGDIKSARSVILKAPQVPGLRIVHLAESGRPVKKGDVVVEFDGSQQDQNVISRTTTVRAADGDIVQTKATQKIDNEADAMSKMSGEYDLERSKLDASKAEVLSAIEGEKNRIQVGVSEGSLQTVKASINVRTRPSATSIRPKAICA
jgi:multidrug efflux pump subunit AcrA (membrane-fusion protein)